VRHGRAGAAGAAARLAEWRIVAIVANSGARAACLIRMCISVGWHINARSQPRSSCPLASAVHTPLEQHGVGW
jgi:hypothetical protein